jgi:hypothetical protein
MFVDLQGIDGPERLALHNVIWVRRYRQAPNTHTCIKSRGASQPVLIITMPYEAVIAAMDAANDLSAAAFAAHMARALLAQAPLVTSSFGEAKL